MIRFTCEHCGRKIRVADTAAGKTGRCPGCQQSVTVPEPALQDLSQELKQRQIEQEVSASMPQQNMIRYECLMCKRTLSAPKDQQGAIKECPHCGSFVEVPVPQKKPDPELDDKIQLQLRPPAQDNYKEPIPEVPTVTVDQSPQKPKRLLPIFLDVFLYPLNKSGILMLLGFTLSPIILFPVVLLGCYGRLLYQGLLLCVLAYMFWYFSLCIQKSAEGEVRAPDTFTEDHGVDMMDMVLQMLRTIVLIIICLLPALICRILTDSAGPVFYGVLTVSIFFLPMMLLASVMFDSFWMAWHPRVVFGGMFSSILSYFVLVFAFYIPIGLYAYISQIGREQENLALALTLNACSIYMIMISSHLLGWFFYRNEEKLYWEV